MARFLSLSQRKGKGGKERTQPGILRGRVPFLNTLRNIIRESLLLAKEETKLYHGLRQRWHLHSDAASVASVHPLIAPLFCQFPSEDLSSGKRSKSVPADFFFSLLVSHRSSTPRTFWKENFRPRGRALSREMSLPFSMGIWSKHFYLYSFRSIKPLLVQSLLWYFDY